MTFINAHCRPIAALFACAAAALLLSAHASAALGFGHNRARTRALPYSGVASVNGLSDLESAEEAEPLEEPATHVATPEMETKAVGGNAGERMAVLIAPARFRPGPRAGYLADGPPNALRFSDDDTLRKRQPSPALPEFSMMPNEYAPYLIESPLAEDARNDPALLSEIVVDLSPHTVVSGVIDLRRKDAEVKVEHFDLEENRTSALRPADVLKFFESDGVVLESSVLVPFSPAAPSAETIKSSAKLRTE